MSRIIIAVTNDLATDQRVDRTCRALAEEGWHVTLVGRRLHGSPALAPRPYGTRRMRLLFRRSALFYAEYNIRLFLLMLFSRADAFFANDTDTLLAATLASRLRHKSLYYDAHELFPDVPELQGRPRVQAVWKWVERTSLPHVTHAFTVCQSVADEYRRRYGVDMTVVRNVPIKGENMNGELKKNEKNVNTNDNLQSSISNFRLLYQGAVNIGRGIREMVDVMELLPECHLVVAGDGDVLEEMKQYSATRPWHDRVEFLGRVQPDRLQPLTAQADLGLCLLEDLGLNYRYSLPNRIADLAQAGVPVLATDFPEIHRVIEEYGTGTLFEPLPADKSGDTYRQYIARLAEAVRTALRYWSEMPPEEYRRRFAKAGEELNWQHEKYQLINVFRSPAKQL